MTASIWCIGKNYKKHAQELSERIEKEPIVFLKSGACIVSSGSIVKLPSFSLDVQYEIEIACLFDEELNLSHFTLALDLTARDVQSRLKANGLPWTLAKSFKQSCPLGVWQQMRELSHAMFCLGVNGVERQKGCVKDMIFSIAEIKEHLLAHFPIQPGDIMLTGTPEGISRVVSGDKAEVYCDAVLLGSWTFL